MAITRDEVTKRLDAYVSELVSILDRGVSGDVASALNRIRHMKSDLQNLFGSDAVKKSLQPRLHEMIKIVLLQTDRGVEEQLDFLGTLQNEFGDEVVKKAMEPLLDEIIEVNLTNTLAPLENSKSTKAALSILWHLSTIFGVDLIREKIGNPDFQSPIRRPQ
jgi:hypothetical protein